MQLIQSTSSSSVHQATNRIIKYASPLYPDNHVLLRKPTDLSQNAAHFRRVSQLRQVALDESNEEESYDENSGDYQEYWDDSTAGTVRHQLLFRTNPFDLARFRT